MPLIKLQAEGLNLADTFAFSGTVSGAGGGKVLQTVSTTKTDAIAVTINGNTASDITGLSVNITPSATSSKILVWYSVYGACNHPNRQATIPVRLLRGSTEICHANDANNRARLTAGQSTNGTDDGNVAVTVSGNFLDSPNSTSQQTYKMQFFNIADASKTYVCNSTNDDGDVNNFRPRGTSTITVMEISA